jgi:PH domain
MASSSSSTIAERTGVTEPLQKQKSSTKKSGEPHRIYWQQWIVSSGGFSTPQSHETETKLGSTATTTSTTTAQQQQQQQQPYEERLSRRELITSSAAVRLSRAAKAVDLTELLRTSLHLPEPTTPSSSPPVLSPGGLALESSHDALVLVGTLYSLPRHFVQFEHDTQMQHQSLQHHDESFSYRTTNDPFHIVRTLHPNECPLTVRDEMVLYLNRYLERCDDLTPTIPSVAPVGTKESTLFPPIPLSSVQSSSSFRSSSSATVIAPKLQWYYVPAAVDLPSSSSSTMTNALIPNCVELDGYCTALENNAYNDDTDDDNDDNSDDEKSTIAAPETLMADVLGKFTSEERDFQKLCGAFPWLAVQSTKESTTEEAAADISNQCKDTRLLRRVHREDQRFAKLSMSVAASSGRANVVTGYLLKQDAHDRNVWRRMYCTLTNDSLWFVSRVYTRTSKDQCDEHSKRRWSYAKHRRIKLTRALLVEPNAGYAPLFRTPYALEIVSARGTSHVFRANSKQIQTMWISSVSDRIMQAYENSLMKHAELIVTDECLARSRRMISTAVKPLWTEAVRVANDHHSDPSKPSVGNSIGSVLRWGMDVALYRDRCRFIGTSMPAKTPIVIVTPPRRRFFSSATYRSNSNASSPDGPATEPDHLDTPTSHMIRVTWDHAAALLARARSLALTLQVRSSLKHDDDGGEPVRLSHGVDALCRHIEFVVTGRMLHSKETNSNRTIASDTALSTQPQDDVSIPSTNCTTPPPADLFDHLLAELQSLAANADRKIDHGKLSDSYQQHITPIYR